MSLYESLSEFVGAGLLASAPAIGVNVPTGTVKRGNEFATFLRGRGEAAQLGTILDALAQEIWLSQDTRGVPHQISESHAEALVATLEDFRPDPAALAAAIEKSRQGQSRAASAADPAHRHVAQDIFARASEAGALSRAGMWDEVALYLLDRLFAHLLDDPRLLVSLWPALREFLGAQHADGLAVATQPGPVAAVTSELRVPPPGPTPAASASPATQQPAAPPAVHPQDDAIKAIQARYGVSDPALARFLKSLEPQDLRADRFLERLEDMAGWLKTTHEHLLKPSNEVADVRRLKTGAAEAIANGEFELAMDQLKQVRRNLRDTRRRIEERLQDEMHNLKSQMAEEALATARLGELALARFELDSAAELFAEAVDMAPANDHEARWRSGMRHAEALVRKGEVRRDVAAFREATRVYEGALKLVPREEPGGPWAATQLSLGAALTRIGQMEDGTLKLKEAVAAFNKALPLLPRQSEARRWALAHMQLGHARSAIGEREASPQAFVEAADSYRQALQELSAAGAPLDWALTKAGLGNALLGQDERLTSAEARPALLGEAGEAFQAALTILSPEQIPAEWADAQLNLGNALLGLGEVENANARYEGAVAAYLQALCVHTRQSNPSQWSLAKMNLANALASLAERQPGASGMLLEARAAYEDSLAECSRETSPMRWAITRMNLGTVLIRLGELGDKRQHWLAAAAAMVPALEIFEVRGAKEYADLTRRSLHRVHVAWDGLLADKGAS